MKQGSVRKEILAFVVVAALIGPWTARMAVASTTPIMQTMTDADKAALGPLWRVTEPGTWSGWWAQRKNTGALAIFDAGWKNAAGALAKDVIYVQSWNRATGQITLYRAGNKGRYYGVFKNDAVKGGTASWYAAGWTWSAFVVRRAEQIPDDQKGQVTIPH